jgi:putative tryptophan/tyrosine transport system substrate-binding protein
MNRRTLLLLLSSAVMVSTALRAQRKAMPVIGFLGVGSPGSQAVLVAAFHEGLSQTGWGEGQNVMIEYRWAEGHSERLPTLAADLVDRKVDVIAAMAGTPPAVAAKGATSTIPIVFSGGDPVERGLVASLARPGGNLTGVSSLDLSPKRLEMLSELVPGQVDRPIGKPEQSVCREHHKKRSGSGALERGAASCPESQHRNRDRCCFHKYRADACRWAHPTQ